jgi:hypothetical protein
MTTPFRAGAAKAKITPSPDMGPVYRAGYKMGEAEQLHGVVDDIYVRCLTIENDGTRIAFVSFDLIGLLRDFTLELASRLKTEGIKPEHLLVATTHTHSGPDTMGLWGPSIDASGYNEVYGDFLLDTAAASVKRALASAQPAQAFFAFEEKNLGATNYHSPSDINLDLWRLMFKGKKQVVGSLISYPAQPELTPRHADKISAGYPGEACAVLDKKSGGTTLFLLGACGGMEPEGCEKGFDAAHAYGRKLSDAVLELTKKTRPISDDSLSVTSREISLPIENPGFQMMMEAGMIRTSQRPPNGTSTISKVLIGDIVILTVPGEPFPGIVAGIGQKGQTLFVSQINDSLGYFIPPEDFNPEPKPFEEGEHFTSHELESLGIKSGEIIRRELDRLNSG